MNLFHSYTVSGSWGKQEIAVRREYIEDSKISISRDIDMEIKTRKALVSYMFEREHTFRVA